MLLDSVRPIDIYDVGYLKILMRGILLACLQVLLLYISYTDENPTSFVYLLFAGLIFASKMRLRASDWFEPKDYSSAEKTLELEDNIRDNKVLFSVGVMGRVFYLIFAIVVTIIFGCSVAYNRIQNENDAYPFF